MEEVIRRVQPEAAIQSGAVRPVGPRRQGSGQGFASELADHAGTQRRDPDEHEEPEGRDVDRSVGPPDGEETGGQIDVTG